jgi:NADH-quinone oxidoreductase subunit L
MAGIFWLIPLVPAASSVVLVLSGSRISRKAVSLQACLAVLVSFILSLAVLAQILRMPPGSARLTKTLLGWITSGAFSAPVTFSVDPLAAVMCLVVTGVGFLIHVYSVGYMAEDRSYARYFGLLNLFTFFMLVLVMASNIVLMFVGWEGVGLCSYLLIGFWFERSAAAKAGMKAFIVNRIGDAGFILGILFLVSSVGSPEFAKINAAAAGGVLGPGLVTLAAILLFIGAAGKSAQIPLYVWLPDAMEGPTPVSALIHAATMVTAGVYMVARLNGLYSASPAAGSIVASIGAVTAVFAASIALVQTDIKKVLAYSTISQLGYMFIGCGVGAYGAGIFHLTTHAFFKSLLFLGAGSVIHALSGEQDMRKMGALKTRIPTTYWMMGVAALAISGIPPLAGFVSKDEILWQSFAGPYGHRLLWAVGWITAGLTAFYMFRLIFMTFWGESRVPHDVEHHIHESPQPMLIPLVTLAILSIVGGFIGWPKSLLGGEWFGKFLEPVFEGNPSLPSHDYGQGIEYFLMGLSVVTAIAGISIAYWMYVQQPALSDRVSGALAGFHRVLLHKYYVDEIYDALFVNRVKDVGSALAAFDLGVVDGGVNGVGWTTRMSAELSRLWDTWIIDGLVNVMAFIVKILSWPARIVQTGLVQNYAWFITVGVMVFMLYYVFH